MALVLAPDADLDNSTIWTATTPPESVAEGLPDNESQAEGLRDDESQAEPARLSTPVPRPGHTFLIRSVSSGEVITLVNGQIVLAHPDGRESHWVCEDVGGWFGFRNVVSGRFLGRNWDWDLCCSAPWGKEWEIFRAHQLPEGGTVLLMTHWWTERPVGIKRENGAERLAMIENWQADAAVWEFVEVQ